MGRAGPSCLLFQVSLIIFRLVFGGQVIQMKGESMRNDPKVKGLMRPENIQLGNSTSAGWEFESYTVIPFSLGYQSFSPVFDSLDPSEEAIKLSIRSLENHPPVVQAALIECLSAFCRVEVMAFENQSVSDLGP